MGLSACTVLNFHTVICFWLHFISFDEYHEINLPGVPPIATISRRSTALYETLSTEERADKIARWGEIRAMTKDEASANLSGEELEMYNRYYEEMREGVMKMQEFAQFVMKDVDKEKRIKPKSKGQRKRDRWAIVQKREAAKATAAH